MNFIAIIGIVAEANYDSKMCELKLKVEKSEQSSDDNWYDLITCYINTDVLGKEFKEVKLGDVVGVKGKIANSNNSSLVIGERIQIF